MSLISLALEGFQEVLETELRRMGREVQMAKLNGHDEDNVPDSIERVPAPMDFDPGFSPPEAKPSRVDQLIAVADAEWHRNIAEPVTGVSQNSAARIDEYIRGALGLGWSTAEVGPKARPNIPYTKDGMFEWCGAFAAWCYGNVGLLPLLRKKHIASTYRLWAWSKGNARRVAPKDIQPGDIVVVGPDGDDYGQHVTIAASNVRADGTFVTYEGNAGGLWPDGTRHTGVVRRTRPVDKPGMAAREYRALFAVRPLDEDYA